jgi:peptidoglycan/xylan/chitin deacetylase (PgdA/CDA1 family)
MSGTWKGAVKRALNATGHYARALAERRFPGIAVLGYHGVLASAAARAGLPFGSLHVDAAVLDAHCELLAAHCQPLTLAEAEAMWAGTVEMPARGVLVTFDDGHRALHDLALPILRKHDVPAVVFACTDPIERQRSFWFDAVARAKGEAAVESAKSMAWNEWHALATAHEAVPAADDALAPMTSAQLSTMAADPLITIGAHTATHPILSRAPRDVQREEIFRSLDAIERITGRRPTSFAYPNGRPGVDYDMTTLNLLREAGITTAFTTLEGFAARGAALERTRFVMLDSIDDAELAHRLAHAWS